MEKAFQYKYYLGLNPLLPRKTPNRDVLQRVYGRAHSTPDKLLTEIRMEIDPEVLGRILLPQLVKTGKAKHTKFLRIVLKRNWPQKIEEPSPFYNQVRSAFLKAIDLLEAKG